MAAKKAAAKAKAPRKAAKSRAKPSDGQVNVADNTGANPAGSETHGVSAAQAKQDAAQAKKDAKLASSAGPNTIPARLERIEKQAVKHGWDI